MWGGVRRGHKLTLNLLVFYTDLFVPNISTTNIIALCDKVSVVFFGNIGFLYQYN